ncbi:helix-turn-helix domain-containing protein [Microbulbifer agarilyticus]
MTKRRPLTAREKIAQQNLRAIWQAKKKALDLTQERAAHQLGWSSQGTVGQYLLGRVPLNTDALLKFAGILHVSPTDIDPDFQWGGMVTTPSILENIETAAKARFQGAPEAPLQEAEIPRHVRDLVDAILKRARDGSLTKEHTAVLKSSLELMTGGK